MGVRIVQRKADELAGAPKGWRRFEFFCTVVFPPLFVTLVYRMRHDAWEWPHLLPLAFLIGLLGADFISGFVHWMADTWGTPDTPLVGKTLIRTFREHHVDQKAITRHDFIETNGSNMWGGSSMLIFALIIGGGDRLHALVQGSLLFFAIFVALTSQIHRWAHGDTPPLLVRWLQWSRLLLTAQHHERHHIAPFDRSYCITCGWLNQPLHSIRFFRTLEDLITALTGALPRHDDIGEEAAIAVTQQVEEEDARMPDAGAHSDQ
jgi:ubiquitin-conjugating enzyme E2 variant